VGGDPATYDVEITQQAERVFTRSPNWRTFLRKAIDILALDPEPNGLDKFVAPAKSGYSGCLLYEVYPWRIVYQLVGPNRVIVVAIAPHPSRM
jgi:mRNA-degrading endonuclease RelE of RelBE toxin-antitoxin system